MSTSEHNRFLFSINDVAKIAGCTWRTARKRIQGIKPAGTLQGEPAYGPDAIRACLGYSETAEADYVKREAEAAKAELEMLATLKQAVPRNYLVAALHAVFVLMVSENLDPRLIDKVILLTANVDDGTISAKKLIEDTPENFPPGSARPVDTPQLS